MTTVRRLNWTFDRNKPRDWINADREEGPGTDIVSDIIVDGLLLETGSIEYISSHHTLEQFKIHELRSALRELQRVLKPGGMLRLGVADLDKAIDAYMNGQSNYFWTWNWKSLAGRFITQVLNHNVVRTPLTYEFVDELLQAAGFSNICRVAYRQTTGHHPEIVALDKRPDDSFFVEATKPFAIQTAEKTQPRGANQVHVSWTMDPRTTLTVTWHTGGEESGSGVEYRQPGGEWSRITATATKSPGNGFLHRATLSNLAPDTDYEYRVVREDAVMPAVSDAFLIRTAPPAGPADFTFALICDTGIKGRRDGNSTGTERVIDELVASRPLFVLGAGDYAYTNHDSRFKDVNDGIDAWFEQMQPLIGAVPFMAQYGNHEIFLNERFRDWAPRFAHPPGFDEQRNYSFEVGDVHCTALFVPDDVLTAEQLLWIDSDLANARRLGMRWLIVFQHEPIYGHGHSHPAKPRIRRLLAPIFERHRVDLHLSGHDQNYERTFPLTNVGEDPEVMSASRDYYEAGTGVIYAKVSPAGKMSEFRNDFSRFTTEQQPFIATRDDTAHHYALITVRSVGELRVEVFAVVNDYTPAALLDSFLIVRAAS